MQRGSTVELGVLVKKSFKDLFGGLLTKNNADKKSSKDSSDQSDQKAKNAD